MRLFIYTLILAIGFTSCTPNKKELNNLTIATSANMQFVIHELCEQFSHKTGIECTLVVASSGKLTAQIIKGAPYDVLVAANMKYPNEIVKWGINNSQPKVYALGQLALWTAKKDTPVSFDLLNDSTCKHIAIANPASAPYGVAAIETLEKTGQLTDLKDKLVYGESISQCNQFVLSKNADVGFTALSVVLSPKLKGKGSWMVVDTSYYNPLEQGIVTIKRENGNTAGATKFYEYIFSSEAKDILKDFGYLVNE